MGNVAHSGAPQILAMSELRFNHPATIKEKMVGYCSSSLHNIGNTKILGVPATATPLFPSILFNAVSFLMGGRPGREPFGDVGVWGGSGPQSQLNLQWGNMSHLQIYQLLEFVTNCVIQAFSMLNLKKKKGRFPKPKLAHHYCWKSPRRRLNSGLLVWIWWTIFHLQILSISFLPRPETNYICPSEVGGNFFLRTLLNDRRNKIRQKETKRRRTES